MSDWYARKLRGESAPKQAPLPPTPVARPQMPPTPQVQQPKQFRPQNGAVCPNCGSANYGSPARNIPPRCFDCGEGLAIQNTTQGMAAPGGETHPAVQVPSAGYNPQAIIGKVG
jgi:hypothetical protein